MAEFPDKFPAASIAIPFDWVNTKPSVALGPRLWDTSKKLRFYVGFIVYEALGPSLGSFTRKILALADPDPY